MYGQTWIDINTDFGLPYKRIAIMIRSLIGREILQVLDCHKVTDLERVKALVCMSIYKVRPEWKDKIIICSISYDGMRGVIIVELVSALFPSVKQYNSPDIEYLEACPICQKCILFNGHHLVMYRKTDEGAVEERVHDVCQQSYNQTDKPIEVQCHHR